MTDGEGNASAPRLRVNDIVMDCPEHEPALAFWEQALGYVRGWASGQFAQLHDPANVGVPLLFQRVPEGKIVKNRVHMDLAATDMHAEVERLAALGARRLRELQEMGAQWTVMIDPVGNEFCVVQGG